MRKPFVYCAFLLLLIQCAGYDSGGKDYGYADNAQYEDSEVGKTEDVHEVETAETIEDVKEPLDLDDSVPDFLQADTGNDIPQSDMQGDMMQAKVKFSEVNEKVFAKQCVPCHQGAPRPEPVSGQPHFVNNYTETQKTSEKGGKVFERIKIRAVDQGTMPPSGPLSETDKKLIADWVKDGAIE